MHTPDILYPFRRAGVRLEIVIAFVGPICKEALEPQSAADEIIDESWSAIRAALRALSKKALQAPTGALPLELTIPIQRDWMGELKITVRGYVEAGLTYGEACGAVGALMDTMRSAGECVMNIAVAAIEQARISDMPTMVMQQIDPDSQVRKLPQREPGTHMPTRPSVIAS